MASHKKETVQTSDGLDLIVEVDVPAFPPRGVVILLHGWSGSPRHFDRNISALITSGYIALFGPERLATHTFVDQVPLQNRDPATGWTLGSRGIFDGPSLAAVRAALVADAAAAAADTVDVCLTRRPPAADAAAFVAEATRADGAWLGRLMADHTALDWRPLLRAWRGGPVLVVVGGATKCHDPAGVRAVGELIGSDATTVEMEGGSHWCYWEDAPAFNKVLLAFLEGKASE
ncbi:hypothetical protein I4F81_002775 [Pyropia yezoensis]|uniref:Uncharacterized protein n=1 Tax=Pyropia yezoensis TaxID=2788 RepID=A0ACC3BR45_PYRYE|nr:hypothetical protein I4F81_002775 [Neopyropia yezoensis]